MPAAFHSRKFLMAAGSAILIAGLYCIGWLSEANFVTMFLSIVGGYIGLQGVQDTWTRKVGDE